MGPRPDGRTGGRGRALAGSWALLFAALLLSLALGELGLRLAGYTAIYEIYSKPSLFWVHDDLLGWSHQPGAEGVYVGPRPFPIEYETPIRINALGLRGPEVGPKQPGEYRVLVLGDSVTAAFEVPYEHTYVDRLERLVARRLGAPVRFINAAVRGYGTDQQYLYYRERGRALDPDLVVLQFSNNDLGDNATLHRMRRPFGKPALAPREDGSLALVGHPVPDYPLCSGYRLNAAFEPERVDGPGHRALCFAQTRAADRSALFTFASQALGRLPGVTGRLRDLIYPDARSVGSPDFQRGRAPALAGVLALPAAAAGGEDVEVAITKAILLELARTVRGDGVDFFVYIVPRDLRRLDDERLRAEIDFRYADLPANLQTERLSFRNDSHFNEWGHRILARGLRRSVLAYARPWARSRASDGETPGR